MVSADAEVIHLIFSNGFNAVLGLYKLRATKRGRNVSLASLSFVSCRFSFESDKQCEDFSEVQNYISAMQSLSIFTVSQVLEGKDRHMKAGARCHINRKG